MSRLKIIGIVVVILAVGAFLWWTISPLFIDTEVQDELDPDIAALLEAENPSLPANENPVNEVMGEPVPESDRDATANTTATSELPQTVIEGPFTIVDTPTHPATGSIRTIRSPEETIVRFENYDGTNGPDLFVYLAKDLDANEFVNLGRAKGNQGNINYTVPEDVDIDEYQYVMTWCKAFGVLFDYAEIN